MVYHEEDLEVSNSLLNETNDVHIALLPLFSPPYNRRFKTYSNLNIIMNTISNVSRQTWTTKTLVTHVGLVIIASMFLMHFFIVNNVDFPNCDQV
jgi:hypothetical protein